MSSLKREFYETTIRVRVLSDVPLEWDTLNNVNCAIASGDCVGSVEETANKRLTGKQMARKLRAFGSEPAFFQLNEKGEQLNEKGE
jgi:hypothetical protein